MTNQHEPMSVAEILEELQRDEFQDIDVAELFVEPPEPNILSDEDSADEDEGGMIDNLSSRQLAALGEVVLTNNIRMGVGSEIEVPYDVMPQELAAHNADEQPPSTSISEESTAGSSVEPSTSGGTSRKRKRLQPDQSQTPTNASTQFQPTNFSFDRRWKKDDLFTTAHHFPESDFTKYRDFSPVELFQLFFDEELFDLMINEIKKYAAFKNVPDPNITKAELKCFFGILIISGYNSLPGKRYYWETSDDVRNHLICKSMRRNRFTQIMSLLHFVDSTRIDRSDKLWKLRPLIDKLKINFGVNFVPVQQLDFDESMIAYYGRHSCKQFIRGKPIRFGYKAWCLNTFSGYLVDFSIYQGRTGSTDDAYDKAFGKSAAPLVRMLNDLEPCKVLPYHIYFDNLFTGLNLLSYLRDQNFHGTGTIRANRVPKDCKLCSPNEIKKKERGFYDHSVSSDNIIITRWQDNAPVTVASTIHGINPLSHVKRYSRKEKKTVLVKRPSLIGEYNKFMGGTDLMDENVNRYRVGIRSKKWWWPIFSWCLDVSLQNAWYLYNMANRPRITQLEFKRAIAVYYLQTFGTEPQVGGRPSLRPQSTPAFEELRYDGLNHIVIENEKKDGKKKKRRCARAGCKSFMRTSCKKCAVGLCIPCFLPFHTRN
ncbi:piggyBac transposable element-derived protein 3 isoform X1 [Nilaparvata lugens]|uniref:piggyBac transposable element-derived protein 3 isoform X1 n=2 Tax=Nilaparvata lugens TaxID=108931 RepID=UPI00193D09ED|nr:piggyBac transposable element-derived protein 3 isoform X1 [Nilaparvata lugens]